MLIISYNMETFKFEAEITQLMHLIVNAFYSNKDVFLRELISNASDALDKVKYMMLTNQEILHKDPTLEIRIMTDKLNNALTITDTGVGMSKEELIKNLGTVARSGTKAFIESLKDKKDLNMIGQFGVGFYSAYLVGTRVKVISTGANSDKTYIWESTAEGSFTVTECTDETVQERGTKITIFLKDTEKEYLEEDKIKSIIEKHSNYINYPIMLFCTKTREKEPTEPEEKIEQEKSDKPEKDGKIEEVNEDEDKDEDDKEPEKKKEMETYTEWEKVNKQDPLWTKSSSDITPEQYTEFYKSFTNSWDDYMFVNHFKAEGSLEFNALLYIPKTAPYDMFKSKEWAKGVKLYVRRVFITDRCDELIPEYLSFMKGVVDSNDLPLNVSREMLQHNTVLKKMKKHVVKKTIDLLTKSAEEEPAKYKQFYEQYSKNIKLGVHEDTDNRDKLVKLLRFFTMTHKEEAISLQQYIKEMPDTQKDIYYITGESIANLEDSPFLETLKKRNYDVLLLVEPIDEYSIQQIKDFEGKQLVDVTKEGLKLDDTKKKDEAEEDFKKLCKHIKEILGDKVEKVIVSKRELETPCVLTTGQMGWSANMERIMKAQALQSNEMAMFMKNRKTLEINPNSQLVTILKNKFDADKTDKTVKDLSWLMYETSLLTSGFSLEKPSSYANRIYKMLAVGLSGVSPDEFVAENFKQPCTPDKQACTDKDCTDNTCCPDKQACTDKACTDKACCVEEHLPPMEKEVDITPQENLDAVD